MPTNNMKLKVIYEKCSKNIQEWNISEVKSAFTKPQ